MDDEEEEKKGIEVVSGDGTEIEISPVYDHIILDKPNNNNEKKGNIIIPKEKKEKENDNNN